MSPVANIRVLTAVSVAALAAASGVRADTKQPVGKRIAVAAFNAPEAPRARNEVLAELSEHTEVEVVALEDIAFEARRLQVDEKQTEGRLRLSEELGIDAWLDGTVGGDSARFTLRAPDGEVIASTSLQGENINIMAGLAGQKIWRAMGPLLSARELHKRRIENQEDLAREKVKLRERELSRLRQVVRDRAAERVKALRAAQVLAREKRAAFVAELQRQKAVVHERVAAADRARLEDERREREERLRQKQAEEAEFAASLRQSDGPPPAPVTSVWGGGGESGAPAATRPSATNVWSMSASDTPTEGRSSDSAALAAKHASPSPARATQSHPSPWLMAHGSAPHASPPSDPRPRPRTASPSSATNMEGLSPATRRWLEQQQMR